MSRNLNYADRFDLHFHEMQNYASNPNQFTEFLRALRGQIQNPDYGFTQND